MANGTELPVDGLTVCRTACQCCNCDGSISAAIGGVIGVVVGRCRCGITATDSYCTYCQRKELLHFIPRNNFGICRRNDDEAGRFCGQGFTDPSAVTTSEFEERVQFGFGVVGL